MKGKKDRGRENKETRGETEGEEPVDGKKGCAKRKKKETDEGEGQGGRRKDVREGERASEEEGHAGTRVVMKGRASKQAAMERCWKMVMR